MGAMILDSNFGYIFLHNIQESQNDYRTRTDSEIQKNVDGNYN